MIHLGFKSKKIRVNLNLPIKAETKAESTDVLKAVDEDRKYVIQATIVRYVCFPCVRGGSPPTQHLTLCRIMKARKTMKNQPLIQEVISQISQRFAPKIPDIKKVTTFERHLVRLSNQLPPGYRHSPGEGIYRTSRGHARHLCLRRLTLLVSRLASLSFPVAYCSCSRCCSNVYNRTLFPSPSISIPQQALWNTVLSILLILSSRIRTIAGQTSQVLMVLVLAVWADGYCDSSQKDRDHQFT